MKEFQLPAECGLIRDYEVLGGGESECGEMTCEAKNIRVNFGVLPDSVLK